MPEMYLVVLYFVFGGFLIPSFGDFGYYFMLDEEMGPGISKFTYSVLGIIGQVTGILGSFWYERNLKHVEVRTILFWGLLVSIVSSFCSYIFAKRWNLEVGISDMVFIVLTNTVFGVVALAMNILPTLALFARITPKGIEGTIFAFLTGTFNLANQVFSPMVGARSQSSTTPVFRRKSQSLSSWRTGDSIATWRCTRPTTLASSALSSSTRTSRLSRPLSNCDLPLRSSTFSREPCIFKFE